MKKKNSIQNDLNIVNSISMLELSYQILENNRDPMSIHQLIKKVLEMKKIDISDENKISQLYLDIILSGRFVFHGNDLWSIKKNNLSLWDQEYFILDTIEEKLINDEEILDFDEFVLRNKKKKDNTEEEKDANNFEHLDEALEDNEEDLIDEDEY
ncbi:DNA-directed RNA polymerase subunit delta [Candidatus Phytoplasma pini]|uniref:RNAP delta factor n=1 Tax=Candidatus Phytoplasma pini TaxID=267362 RepID=A0A559KJT7_9MOLU|nr:DNA-directed RNA polymerase subunit delta [Candidatus Phytoplasma pini]TVY12379.1 hypothetical protein MDPP_00153 [Candidatus Phytoplasma pini]